MNTGFKESGDIVHLNVGGTRFSTSKQTLTWIPDSFFSSLVSGRIPSLHDDKGAIFIDRDPLLFSRILNYLRTKEVDLSGIDTHALRHEAEYYGITTLVKRLSLCEELDTSSCGDVLFHGVIPPPNPPFPELESADKRQSYSSIDGELAHPAFRPVPTPTARLVNRSERPGSNGHLQKTSTNDLRLMPCRGLAPPGQFIDPLRVTILRGHFNWIAVAYPHFVSLYRLKESTGWILAWTSPYLENYVERLALNAKAPGNSQENCNRMLAISYGNIVQLWCVNTSIEGTSQREIGVFSLNVGVDALFFIGSQLVALSQTGKVGVWHAMTHNWQIQDVSAITSHDTAGSFLLLGCSNGSIYYIDMQKFPLRMKDNDLLVTELYKDPSEDKITALSVYLTPKTTVLPPGLSGNWIEIAYGTSAGTVRVIVQHPETVGHGPQLFQTFTVHRSPVTKVMLSEKHLVSVCADYNHVRSWSVTRFRGMINTQPGSVPLASFKIVSVDDVDPVLSYRAGNDYGPFGEKDEEQVFIQKVVPETDTLFIRYSSTGKRVCVIKSVDSSTITAFCVHECEGSSRMGSRPRRYLFTGHNNGSIQMWDLSTALEFVDKGIEAKSNIGGPGSAELMRLLDQCELSNSRNTTPSVSPSPSLMSATHSATNPAFPQLVGTPQSRRRLYDNRSLSGSIGNVGDGNNGNGSPATTHRIKQQEVTPQSSQTHRPPVVSEKTSASTKSGQKSGYGMDRRQNRSFDEMDTRSESSEVFVSPKHTRQNRSFDSLDPRSEFSLPSSGSVQYSPEGGSVQVSPNRQPHPAIELSRNYCQEQEKSGDLGAEAGGKNLDVRALEPRDARVIESKDPRLRRF